jgi:hypothetical protein
MDKAIQDLFSNMKSSNVHKQEFNYVKEIYRITISCQYKGETTLSINGM